MTAPIKPRPDFISVGPSVKLANRRVLSDTWKISPRRLNTLLKRLGIPSLRIGADTYFNLVSLEAVLYIALRPGETNLRIPDYTSKANTKQADSVLSLPAHLLEELRDPHSSIHAERALAGLSATVGDYQSLRTRVKALAAALIRGGSTPKVKRKKRKATLIRPSTAKKPATKKQ